MFLVLGVFNDKTNIYLNYRHLFGIIYHKNY